MYLDIHKFDTTILHDFFKTQINIQVFILYQYNFVHLTQLYRFFDINYRVTQESKLIEIKLNIFNSQK